MTQMIHTPRRTAVAYSRTGIADRVRWGPPTTNRAAPNAKYAMKVYESVTISGTSPRNSSSPRRPSSNA